MKICQRQGWWFAKKIVYLHRKKSAALPRRPVVDCPF